MKTTGVLGGTFDPVHIGHLQCASFILKEKNLDEILFVPAGTPPHKDKKITSSSHRLCMLELAKGNTPQMTISRAEIERPGPHFSIDTMRQIKKEHPATRFFFVLGEDNIPFLHTWHEYRSFIEENEFILLRREGVLVKNNLLKDKEFKKIRDNSVQSPLVPCSSTLIREKIRNRESAAAWLHPKVWEYIIFNRLYVD
jgi:nicotinate-nucleotide adenylyltransferase